MAAEHVALLRVEDAELTSQVTRAFKFKHFFVAVLTIGSASAALYWTSSQRAANIKDVGISTLTGLWNGTQCKYWISTDNCASEDEVACECRRLNPNGPCTHCPHSVKRSSVNADPDATPTASPSATSSSAPSASADTSATDSASKPVAPQRRGSFLVIGDWGYDFACHGNVPKLECQETIAKKMLDKMVELGDVKFIINVGDSFYPHGVTGKHDPQWDSKWRNIFDKKLRSVPWYSVYGNHDYQHDPCACSEQCAQVNSNISDLDYFYMPGYNWAKIHEELQIEIVALELNHFMLGYDQSRAYEAQHFEDCQYTTCESKCVKKLKSRADEAFKLFNDRASKSTMKNLVVFSHYPTDYFHSVPNFLQSLRDSSKHHILYLGGHRHNVDQSSTTSIEPNENWLVGGGGGWSCDGPNQGFVVGEISHSYELTTYPVFVDKEICCLSYTPPSRWKGQGCDWLGCDNCLDPKMCECRAQNPDGPCTACPNSTSKGMVCSGKACSFPS